MTDPTDTPAPVEPRHRERAASLAVRWGVSHDHGMREKIANALARGEQEGRRLEREAIRQELQELLAQVWQPHTREGLCMAEAVLNGRERGDHLQESDDDA